MIHILSVPIKNIKHTVANSTVIYKELMGTKPASTVMYVNIIIFWLVVFDFLEIDVPKNTKKVLMSYTIHSAKDYNNEKQEN